MNNVRPGCIGLILAAISLLVIGGAIFTALVQTQLLPNIPSGPNALPTQAQGQSPATLTPIVNLDDTLVPTATPEGLPTETTQSTQSVSPTLTQTVTSQPSGTPLSPSTITPTSEPVVCTHPAGWVTYRVKSGDTLYSLSKLFKTTVAALQAGNCMGASTTIVTGKYLWVPSVATSTPKKTDTPKPVKTSTPKPPTSTPVIKPTDTPLPPTATFTPTYTPTPTSTPTYTATSTPTATITPTIPSPVPPSP